jgi:hypothetical protein
MKERALALEDAIHERAYGLREGHDQQKIDQYERDADSCHLTTSKFFRAQQGVH